MTRNRDDPVREEYDGLAGRYDRIWARYIRASTRETLKRTDPGAAGRVLDMGCGTGAFLEALTSDHDDIHVAGVDLSEEMLARARVKLGPAPDLRIGNVENLPFEDAMFNMVTSISMFHYLRDPDTALSEARRVLRPGGRIIITDWCHDYLSCRLLDVFLRLFNRAHYRTYEAAELEHKLIRAGFEDVRAESYKIDALWGMMTVTGRKPA